MTDDPIAAARALIEPLTGYTPGPWGWEVSRVSKRVNLCGGKGGSDLTVMSFARWGMSEPLTLDECMPVILTVIIASLLIAAFSWIGFASAARDCTHMWPGRGHYTWKSGCLVQTDQGLMPADNIVIMVPAE